MEISGMGCKSTYYYNINTQKLQSAEGQSDDFVKWYNGEITQEELPDSYNGYDANVKRDIGFIFDSSLGEFEKRFGETENGLYKVSILGVAADEIEYQVADKKKCTVTTGMAYSGEQENSLYTGSFKERVHEGYNAEDNRLVLAVGDKFSMGDGKQLIVGNDYVTALGKCRTEAETVKMNYMMTGMTRLIRFADQQGTADAIPEECYPDIIELLEKQGVNTSKEFILNETRCHIVNGRIKEVGNDYGVPSSMYCAALREYELLLAEPLNQRKRGVDSKA